jgi:hypothetical protein
LCGRSNRDCLLKRDRDGLIERWGLLRVLRRDFAGSNGGLLRNNGSRRRIEIDDWLASRRNRGLRSISLFEKSNRRYFKSRRLA